MKREELVHGIAAEIIARHPRGMIRVAVDGVDGAGKTVFADELGRALRDLGREVIRVSVDAFHHPRATRYLQGRGSPMGFFADSYDYATLKRVLLEPLSPTGSGRFLRAAFDHRLDQPIHADEEAAPADSILVFDGMFAHRDELYACWDYSIFLRVDFAISIPRGASRGEGSPDVQAESNRRYVEGQRIYFEKCVPEERATVVVDNNDLTMPFRTKPNQSLHPTRSARG